MLDASTQRWHCFGFPQYIPFLRTHQQRHHAYNSITSACFLKVHSALSVAVFGHVSFSLETALTLSHFFFFCLQWRRGEGISPDMSPVVFAEGRLKSPYWIG